MKTIDANAHGVEILENVWIPLPDGQRLAARIFLPPGAREHPVPALFEYIPYRKRDLTRVRDGITHGWFAAHGYACVRVDMRGSGDSDGVLRDQYREQELADGEAAIAWMAAQPWCNGRVGMMGISWGGFNALQIAARRPPALEAVVAVCASDDLYRDNMHYMGGCLLTDNLVEATTMFSTNTCPPDPAIVGDRWRALWIERLSHSGLWIDTWLRHQRRDDYWRHGAVCEDYGAIRAPVLAVGGWHDAFTDGIFRLLEHLEGPRYGIIGPWAHCYPHYALPGPAIGFLQECRRWWDHWLRDEETDLPDVPRLRAWMMDSAPPDTHYEHRPGRWIAEPRWPSAHVEEQAFAMAPGRLYLPDDPLRRPRRRLRIRSPLSVGQFSGKRLTSASGPGMAYDQREEDGGALVFDTLALDEDVEILGSPVVELTIAADRPVAMLCARLSDVAPDDKVTRVSYGMLNLTHRNGHETPEPLEPGARYRVRIPLNVVAQTFRAGHAVRLALSTSYWPTAWPAPEPARVWVHTSGCRLLLPVRERRDDGEPVAFEPPVGAEPPPTSQLVEPRQDWVITRRLGDLVTEQEVIDDNGVVRFDDIDLEVGERMISRFSHTYDDYDSVRGVTTSERTFRRGDWSVRTSTRTVLTSTPTHFRLHAELAAYEGEEDDLVFEDAWSSAIERDLV
ncbi:MAG TPA: CocE/NonD family hydrolase [Sandaracinaceae bacterium LLY-WYZ-13_1]|nr:CocE/NonD family hydrolase [Sandaracinaceae bacterium LLY-WYZ-13_1]